MSDYVKKSIDCFVYSHDEMLSYSLVELVTTLLSAEHWAMGDFSVMAKDNISDIILAMLRSRKKTLVVLDLDSVYISEKISIIEKLNAVCHNFKVIALCNEREYENFRPLYAAVFDAILLKTSSVSLVRQVITHEIDNIMQKEQHENVDILSTSTHHHFLMLTPREDAILRKLISGKNSTQIASELFISNKTVYTHRSNIYAKFNVRTLTELYNRLKQESLIGNGLVEYHQA